MRTILIILIIALLSSSCTNIDQLVTEIDVHNTVESEYIGYGYESEQFKRFNKLKKNASNKKLLELLDHKSPVVRTYAGYAVIDKELEEPIEVLKKFLYNDAKVDDIAASQIGTSNISTLIYFRYYNTISEFDDKKFTNRIIRENDKIKKIDSLIIYEINENHFLHYMALNDKIYGSNFNERINELALEKNVSSAIFYINRHDIKTDTIKMIQSIQSVLKNQFLGSEPEKEMIKVLNRYKSN